MVFTHSGNADDWFGMLFECNPLPMWIYDTESLSFLNVNEAAIEFYGYSREEFLNLRVSALCLANQPESTSRFLQAMRRPAPDGFARLGGWQHVTKGRGIVWVDVSWRMLRFAGPHTAFAILHDVTGLKTQELLLRQSKLGYESLIEQAGSGIVLLDAQNHILEANAKIATMLGYANGDLLGRTIDSLVAFEKDGPCPAKQEGDHQWEVPLRRQDGSVLWTLATVAGESTTYGGCSGRMAIFSDISVRKATEQALLESGRQLAETRRVANIGTWELDFATLTLRGSPQKFELVGLSTPERPLTEIRWEDFLARIEPEDRAGMAEMFKSLQRFPEPRQVTYRIRQDNGSLRHILCHIQIKRDAAGHVVALMGTSQDISGIRELELARYQAVQRFRTLFDQAAIGMQILDLNGYFLEVNQRFCDILGYSADELVGQHYCKFTDQVDVPDCDLLVGQMQQGHLRESSFEKRYVRKDGRVIWTHVSLSVQHDGDGRPQCLIGTVEDVSERKTAEEQLMHKTALLDTMVEGLPLYLCLKDEAGHYTLANSPLARLFHRLPGDLVGRTCYDFLPKEVADDLTSLDRRALERNGLAVMEKEMDIEGKRRILLLGNQPITLQNGQPGILSFGMDITERKRTEQQAQYLSQHDGLTGLANRMLLSERLEHDIEYARRHQRQVGIIFMDLDRFKIINDSLGHKVGDQVLIETARRLKSVIREEDTVARLGGDEFVVVLADLEGTDEVSHIARRLLTLLRQPIHFGGHQLVVGASLGISMFPRDSEHAEELIRNADLAMYQSKRRGRNNFHFFNESMNEQALERLFIENGLRRAIENNDLLLHYQPRVDLKTYEIVSVEALVRWRDLERGEMSPTGFIRVAEESGLINLLGEWVMREACLQYRRWQDQGIEPPVISLNLSPRQLRTDNLVASISNIIAETGVPGDRLELEITESALMQDIEAAKITLQALQALGIRLSIDDFGTGHSSLAWLKRLPINTLKIDRTFVKDVATSEEDAAIVSGTIAMAHRMRLRVVAEGVEHPDQLDFLARNFCDEAQGFLIHAPLSAEAIQEILRDGLWHPDGEANGRASLRDRFRAFWSGAPRR